MSELISPVEQRSRVIRTKKKAMASLGILCQLVRFRYYNDNYSVDYGIMQRVSDKVMHPLVIERALHQARYCLDSGRVVDVEALLIPSYTVSAWSSAIWLTEIRRSIQCINFSANIDKFKTPSAYQLLQGIHREAVRCAVGILCQDTKVLRYFRHYFECHSEKHWLTVTAPPLAGLLSVIDGTLSIPVTIDCVPITPTSAWLKEAERNRLFEQLIQYREHEATDTVFSSHVREAIRTLFMLACNLDRTHDPLFVHDADPNFEPVEPNAD